jgi:hypothetical protein
VLLLLVKVNVELDELQLPEILELMLIVKDLS